MSLRSRLLLVSVATLAAGLGVLLFAGNVLLGRTVTGVTSSLLRTRLEAQIASLTVTPTTVQVRRVPNDVALDEHAWIFSGQTLVESPGDVAPALNRAAIALGRRHRAREISGSADVQLLSQPLFAPDSRRVLGAVVVGVSAAPFDQLRHKVLVGSLAIALLVLGAGGLAIGRALLGALGPVRRMTRDAEDWGAHDLDRRFDLGPPRDEITSLAATLDHLLERIAASRRHEQRFASDVAHELRTPLAAIRGRAELALAATSRDADGDPVEALKVISAQTERMNTTIDTLIAFARRELELDAEAVDLVAVAREFDGVTVTTELPRMLVEGDAELIRRTLAPLVDNARKHARTAVTIELASQHERVRLAVRDDGAGLDPELGRFAFEPGTRGVGEPDGGAGLGLPLARRLARACGGDVSIGDGPGGCFVLELPLAIGVGEGAFGA